jgi:hypothetical protein
MAKGISEIVGEADGTDGSRVTVYRALRQLFCAACGGTIGEGDLFTRRAFPGQGLRILPRCRGCAPFIPRDAVRGKSALIESLLTPTASEAKPEAGSPARREELVEAVMKRLGPALSRARKGK